MRLSAVILTIHLVDSTQPAQVGAPYLIELYLEGRNLLGVGEGDIKARGDGVDELHVMLLGRRYQCFQLLYKNERKNEGENTTIQNILIRNYIYFQHPLFITLLVLLYHYFKLHGKMEETRFTTKVFFKCPGEIVIQVNFICVAQYITVTVSKGFTGHMIMGQVIMTHYAIHNCR